MKKKRITHENSVFHYSLQGNDFVPDETLYEDKLVELFRLQIINLLEIVELKYQNETVKVDGYSFLMDSEKIYLLHKKGLSTYLKKEIGDRS